VVNRVRGRTSLGCLFTLLLVSVALYFGVNIGEVYWRYYRYQDAMRQEARFAHLRTDQVIATRLASVAEALRLPDDARRPQIHRDQSLRRLRISAHYSERVELPGFVRTFNFAPRAEGTY
jgi:hypothetical protein